MTVRSRRICHSFAEILALLKCRLCQITCNLEMQIKRRFRRFCFTSCK
nr:MAG TPA: hypothetical protein [Caudoviricetes sp.]